MKRGLDWYQRDGWSFRMAVMAAGMSMAQAAVYSLVLDLIYEGGGKTPNNPKHIAAHFSDMGPAKARSVVAELVEMGKLYLVDDFLHEKRAENEAKTREKVSEKRAESGRKGGISSGVSRRESSKNNDISEANASSKTEADIEKRKRREDLPPYSPPAVRGDVRAADLDAEFDRIWPHYPRRVGVGAARKAWVKARAKASFEEIAASLRVFIPAIKGTPIDKTPHLATWLSQERWRDDQTHAANRPRTSTEDLTGLATISSRDDLARLFGEPTSPSLQPQIRAIR